MESGKVIRELREERFLRPTDIERMSRAIADTRGNSDFYVPHSTLADIEFGAVPSIHKLFSLAVCLRVPLEELMLAYGIDSGEVTAFAPTPGSTTYWRMALRNCGCRYIVFATAGLKL